MSLIEPRRILNWHNRYLHWGGSECSINQAVVAAPCRRTGHRMPDTACRQAARALTAVPSGLARVFWFAGMVRGDLMEVHMTQSLLTQTNRQKLLANGARSAAGEDIDLVPVVKLFTPDANATWLLTEIDPDNPDIAFGLCDLGLGCPELGSVSLREIERLRGPLGLPVERDQHYGETRRLSEIAKMARRAGRVLV